MDQESKKFQATIENCWKDRSNCIAVEDKQTKGEYIEFFGYAWKREKKKSSRLCRQRTDSNNTKNKVVANHSGGETLLLSYIKQGKWRKVSAGLINGWEI